MKPDADPCSIKLTQFAKTAGCAAKIPIGTLDKILQKLPKPTDKNLLVGTETSDDAAVYKITEDIATVQTLDFFPPVVDDPYTFGAIAATNALSDIYAMGGDVKFALNIVGFPSCLGIPVLEQILKGGADKVKEADASIVGGHSINIDSIVYGLSVTGIVNPKKIYKNQGSKSGDILVLSKKLGTGVVNTAIKANMADEQAIKETCDSMMRLNKYAKEAAENFDIHACTDVTGFSLAGHAREMAVASDVSIIINTKTLEFLQGAKEYASMGLVPKGTYNNRDFIGKDVEFESSISNEDVELLSDLVFDPQTSGGLLFAVSSIDASKLVDALKQKGCPAFIAGTVEKKQGKFIHII